MFFFFVLFQDSTLKHKPHDFLIVNKVFRWMCVLTRQHLALLLLHLPLTVAVQGAAPAVGQSETLLLLPPLAPGRVSHRLITKTERENEETILVRFQVFHFQVNTINPKKSIQCAATHWKMNKEWWAWWMRSQTEHAEWKIKSIWAFYTEMKFLLKNSSSISLIFWKMGLFQFRE